MSRDSLREKVAFQTILEESSLFDEIHRIKRINEPLLMELNTSYQTNVQMVNALEKITGQSIDVSVTVSQPFYSDFGAHIRLGKNVFINKNVTFVDLGGITIEEGVLIGPGASLLTVNHIAAVNQRRGLHLKPIMVRKHAWIGANATILPGVTIGENAIIAASATVTRDIPPNSIVAGNPARKIKKLEMADG